MNLNGLKPPVIRQSLPDHIGLQKSMYAVLIRDMPTT